MILLSKITSVACGIAIAGIFLFGEARAAPPSKIKVLIVDGQNNHAWAATTPVLKVILENTGVFSVDVSTTPPGKPKRPVLPKDTRPAQQSAHTEKTKLFPSALAADEAQSAESWARWRPVFSDYAVVVSNYNGESWPAEVQAALVSFVEKGGGFVSYHAANNAFSDWPAYNRMTGLGGWGGRNEKSGPSLRLRDGVWTKDTGQGPGGGHGTQHEYLVETQAADHPIMRGLPAQWKHAKDELYHRLRGPAEELTVLASALSDRTHEQEPLLMVINFGHGRVFHTALGHGLEAIQSLGFQITFQRGTEWAASGQVSLAPPAAGELGSQSVALRPVTAHK